MVIYCGDCLDVMKEIPDNSVDLILTDPPYGLSFMGKNWDHGVPGVSFWEQAIRVAKPGAHIMAFGGTRTYHRLAVAIEDAGWKIRDTLAWVYGSGFPKSHNISKAIDKAAGAERKVIGKQSFGKRGDIGVMNTKTCGLIHEEIDITAPATLAAKEWEGWGTALKPAFEPIVLARKPFKGAVAANVLEFGTGGINIDACRVGTEKITTNGGDKFPGVYGDYATCKESTHVGRWPANFIHDGSDEVIAMLPGMGNNNPARFFYCAKASSSERGEGNTHPTVKPIALMEYLLKLTSREGATVLDPFMGSGTTGVTCVNTGREFIGIEKEEEYYRIAEKRINEAEAQRKL